MTHKYRGSQQSLREVKPKFIDSTQGEPKNTYKGKVMSGVLKKLDTIAKILLKRHDINCWSKQDTKHLKFQCGFSEEVLISNYH